MLRGICPSAWILPALANLFSPSIATPVQRAESKCQKTQVAIIGAGITGITTAQALSNASITDFLIVEYLGDIGGRVAHTTFGAQANGLPYIVELGANWVQGLGNKTAGGPQNPIWTLAQKYNVTNTYNDYSSIETFNETGAVDYTDLLDDFNNAYSTYEQNAGYIITDGLLDMSVRAAYSLAGWNPKKNMAAQAVEWWEFDWEYSYTPDESSAVFADVNYNTTFYQYSDQNNYVFDSRGFNTIIKGEASTFLSCTLDYNCSADPRLLLNTVVSHVAHTNTGVTVTNADGSCIDAAYAVFTPSIGVLQNERISFTPSLPMWKQQAIATFQMGSYTKIFLQFPPDQVFWNTSTQFFLYADPTTRGYYPVWQSLDGPGFLPGSGIFFVTVVEHQSYAVEAQDDETTKEQVLAVLRDMYGPTNVPEPTAFIYPRWSLEPWAYGSYSNWPPGTTLEQHQNLRANLGRLYFAGEATSTEYYGFLQGAYFEGQAVGEAIAKCLKGMGTVCPGEERYQVLNGTPEVAYNETNGWMVSSSETYGFF